MDKVLKFYICKIFSLVVSFISFLVVVPKLTSSPNIYGLYSSILYLLLFISFSDFGFLPASIKYASESIGKNDRKEEIEIIAFSTFITISITIIVCFFFYYLSINPKFFFSKLNVEETIIAKKLYFGLAIFSPFYALKRCLNIIYQIRVEDYIYQITDTIFTISKICLVSIFITNSKYNIVEYFYSYNIIYILIVVFLFFDIKYRFKYNWFLFFKSFKFNIKIFHKIKSLSFALLFSSISSIFLFQVSMVVLSAMFSVKLVGIFAIGLTITSYMRNIIGAIYQPFTAILNKNYGIGNINYFSKILTNLFKLASPIILVFIGVAYIFSKNLILCWVGNDYVESIIVTKLLILSILFLNVTMPIAEYLKAFKLTKQIRFISIISPISFYSSVFFFYFLSNKVNSFAYAYIVNAIITTLIYVKLYIKYTDTTLIKFIKLNYKTTLVILPIMLILNFYVIDYLPIEQGLIGTLKTILFAFLTGITIIIIVAFTDKYFFNQVVIIIKKVLNNIKKLRLN